MDQSAITRAVTVAGGRFAPGHLGELTQQVPFEMVDAVLEQTCRVQRRVRDLPARVVVYLLLARVPVRRAGLPAGLAPADGRAGRAAGRGPDRVRDDPGPPASRARAAARAVLPAARPGPGRGAVAGAAGCRDRRHDHDRRRQRGEPGRLLQAARRPERRLRLPDAAAAGPGQLRHPHRHRRRVQPRLQRRDHLRPGPARQPARGDDPAGRPQLRRRVPGRADRGNQGGLPDPGPRPGTAPRGSRS